MRSQANITICVGGGIGTPQRAAEYLTGRWSSVYGYPLMPVDGILVGTASMACLEATTSPAVKQLLVDTVGTETWVGAGKAQGGMASGRSQLGADIHEIDNSASRCGRLLDDVAGDAEAVAAQRDEIIAAMALTAKPYFGDVADMTYAQWLRRYVELAIGAGDSTADTKTPDSPWLDVTWRDRFAAMLQRAEARLAAADTGRIDTLFGADSDLLEDPDRAIDALLENLKRCVAGWLPSQGCVACGRPGPPRALCMRVRAGSRRSARCARSRACRRCSRRARGAMTKGTPAPPTCT